MSVPGRLLCFWLRGSASQVLLGIPQWLHPNEIISHLAMCCVLQNGRLSTAKWPNDAVLRVVTVVVLWVLVKQDDKVVILVCLKCCTPNPVVYLSSFFRVNGHFGGSDTSTSQSDKSIFCMQISRQTFLVGLCEESDCYQRSSIGIHIIKIW